MQKVKARFFRLTPQLWASGLAIGLVVSFLFWPAHASVVSPALPAVTQVAVASAAAPAPSNVPNCEVVKCIALTFDDGPDSALTPRILDILKAHNAKATFFVLGAHVGGNEALLRRIHDEGHEIGNHSWNHPHFTRISLQQVQDEVTATQAVIAKAGVPVPHLFRPPYGDVNEAVIAQIPLSVVRWNIDPEDWRPKKQPHLLDHMATHARPGGVVVMHDTESTTADKLDALLSQLESQQYSFVTVSTVLSLSPGQRGVYFARNINY